MFTLIKDSSLEQNTKNEHSNLYIKEKQWLYTSWLHVSSSPSCKHEGVELFICKVGHNGYTINWNYWIYWGRKLSVRVRGISNYVGPHQRQTVNCSLDAKPCKRLRNKTELWFSLKGQLLHTGGNWVLSSQTEQEWGTSFVVNLKEYWQSG
jgi:hypothetical protein